MSRPIRKHILIIDINCYRNNPIFCLYVYGDVAIKMNKQNTYRWNIDDTCTWKHSEMERHLNHHGETILIIHHKCYGNYKRLTTDKNRRCIDLMP